MTRRAVLLKALASMPSDVERMLQGADPSDSGLTGVLQHLLDSEARYRTQFRTVVLEERPVLSALEPGLSDGDAVALGELVDRFKAARQETLAFLEHLSVGDWQRKAIHESLGETSLRFLVQHLVDSDTHHLSQLIAARQGLPSAGELSPVSSPQPARLGKFNPTFNNEVKNERKRTRKWPRKRTRGD
jgi:uncharacterized damage-inducible protein DinB